MNYQQSFIKFINSQYLYTGLSVTAAVIIPSIILYHFDLLSVAIGVPIGAMFVSLTDSPGPVHHRTNGMKASILLNSFMVLIAGFSYPYPWLAGTELAVFGLLLSMAGVFGNRANNIGVMALIAFIIAGSHTGRNPWLESLYFLSGGAWYALFALAFYVVRPYKLIEQLLGECLFDIGSYLHAKSDMYSANTSYNAVYEKLLAQQITIHNLQQDIRELMFKTRRFVKESTNKSRRLMMIFLDSIDLFEQVMTSQQDYEQLHRDFDDSGILQQFQDNIRILATVLQNMGLAIQGSYRYNRTGLTDEAIKRSHDAFAALRKEKLNPSNVEAFIRLRHILYNLEKLNERVSHLKTYLTTNEEIKQRKIETDKFVGHQSFNIQLVLSNISLQSTHFRHALRVTIALLIGYSASLFFESKLGHGYWILLTIASIMKPAFGISRSRNLSRIGGTLTGGVAGFVILYITQNHTVIFILDVLAMAMAYSFLRIQYFISSAFITIYVLLSFYFLQGNLSTVLSDRVLDTFIGCVISFACSYFILPLWEHTQIRDFLLRAVRANRKYFLSVAGNFTGNPPSNLEYKVSRKDAFVALANLSDALQRMLSEPRSRRLHLQEYHQLVTTNHILTSYIASISYYAQQYGNRYEGADFIPMVKSIEQHMNYVVALMEGNPEEQKENVFPFNKRVQKLMEQRKEQLHTGEEGDMGVRKTLSELKSITDQFELVYALVSDEIKILKKIGQLPEAA